MNPNNVILSAEATFVFDGNAGERFEGLTLPNIKRIETSSTEIGQLFPPTSYALSLLNNSGPEELSGIDFWYWEDENADTISTDFFLGLARNHRLQALENFFLEKRDYP